MHITKILGAKSRPVRKMNGLPLKPFSLCFPSLEVCLCPLKEVGQHVLNPGRNASRPPSGEPHKKRVRKRNGDE